MSICANEIVQPVATKAFVQPAKTAGMYTACCDYASPPLTLFGSTKSIFKTNWAN